MSATTVALQTHDVITHIFEGLAIEKHARHYKRRRRRDLARLAHVCRAFVDPALRVLWRVLPGLEPLMRLLSCVGLSERSDDEELFFILLEETIIPAEWQRLKHYARYVQVIDTMDASRFGCGPSPRGEYPPQEFIGPCLTRFLLSSSAGDPLFPCLRRLSWLPKFQVSAPLLFLISPSIRWLAIEHNPPTEQGTRDLESMLTACSLGIPGLEILTLLEFGIDGVENPFPDACPPFTKRTLSAMSKWMYLHRLTIIGIGLDDAFLQTLSVLPRLSSLRLTFQSTVTGREPLIQSHYWLAGLETLELSARGADLAAFCDHVSLLRLRKLSFHSDYFHSDIEFIAAQWFGRFRWSAWAPTLAILRVRIHHESHCHQPVEDCLQEVLQPLLCLHGLEEFTLHMVDTMLPFSDRDALSIGQNWPKLTALSLAFDMYSPDWQEKHPCFMALQYLAEYCPNLQQIVLPAILDRLQVDYNLLTVPRPHNGLRVLLIDCVPWHRDYDSFACYVLRLFPGVQVNRRPADLGVSFLFHKHYFRGFWQALQVAKAAR